MLWKSSDKEKKTEESTKREDTPTTTSKQPNETKNTESKSDNDEDLFNLLPCEHYIYEFKQCSSLKGKLYNYYRGEQPEYDCKYYEELYTNCLAYKRYPNENFQLLLKLNQYENNLMKKRIDSIKQNDVWELRKSPPADWNSPLPDWAAERLKDTYWHKSSSTKK